MTARKTRAKHGSALTADMSLRDIAAALRSMDEAERGDLYRALGMVA